MKITYSFKAAWNGLKANRVRSMLTTLGIVIGISSIILIVSLGDGAERLILQQIEGLGADTIVVRPGKQPTGLSDIAGTLFADSIKEREVAALRKKTNVPHVVSVTPAVVVTGPATYRGESYTPVAFGWSAEFLSDMVNVYPERGVLFDETDIRQNARVVVIGSRVEKELFGGESALGKSVRFRGNNFKVIGIYPKKGQVAFVNIDELMLFPYSTAMTYLTGTDYYNEVMIKVTNPDMVERSVFDIEMTLRELHGITDPAKDDFYIETQQGVVEQVGIILNVLTLFLSSVVAVSLVVGGIGVMNIMLVSVTERTREIGLRKALGATNADIMLQFLVESVLLTFFGGVLGITLGVIFAFAASFGLSFVMESSWEYSFPVNAALMGVGVSSIVGVVFGLYPARKASKKSPIEALRYE